MKTKVVIELGCDKANDVGVCVCVLLLYARVFLTQLDIGNYLPYLLYLLLYLLFLLLPLLYNRSKRTTLRSVNDIAKPKSTWRQALFEFGCAH